MTTSAMASEIGESADIVAKSFVIAPPRATSHNELELAPPPCASCAAGEALGMPGFS